MTPRDYAREIEPGASEKRLQQIEPVLRKMLADELCRVAALIDDEDRRNTIRFPTEAAQICREQAQVHTDYT